VVSSCFEGLQPLERHRRLHAALQPELSSGALHALSLQALTPGQAAERQGLASICRKQNEQKRLAWVEERLNQSIAGIEWLEVEDVSDGHTAVGFTDGSRRSLNPNGIELRITVVSSIFEGMRLLERQRLVSTSLAPELASGVIHALPRLRTLTPSQWCKASEAVDLEKPGCGASDERSPKFLKQAVKDDATSSREACPTRLPAPRM